MKNGHWICTVCLLVACAVSHKTLWGQQPQEVVNKFSALKSKVQSESDWKSWRDFIFPDEADLKWKQIPWLPTFSEGIEKASKVDKPILLWTMNGHPLGCT